MKKKIFFSLIVIIVVVILVVVTILFSNKGEQSTSPLEAPQAKETGERESQQYKIKDDAVLINNLQADNPETKLNNMNNAKLTLSSPDFSNEGSIPAKYTCDGENTNPSLEIAGVVPEAKSLVLLMDDPDAPSGVWDHWIKFNIPVDTTRIEEGIEPEGMAGKGTGDNMDYSGPCPPDKEHRYFFKLYALDTELTLPEGSSKAEVEKAMDGHILQTAELMGHYERKAE